MIVPLLALTANACTTWSCFKARNRSLVLDSVSMTTNAVTYDDWTDLLALLTLDAAESNASRRLFLW